MTISSRSRVTAPNAPYVLTRCSGSKLAFINCRPENRLRAGRQLSQSTIVVTKLTTIACGRVRWAGTEWGTEKKREKKRSSKHGRQSTIGMKLSHERLPLRINVI